MSRLQRQILGAAHVTREWLRARGEADERAHYVHRLGLWAIYRHPAVGRRGPASTAPIRAARAALSRAAARLERRGLLTRHHGTAWHLTPPGGVIGGDEAGPFRGLIDPRALCGLEIIRDAPGVARREWGSSPAELRGELSNFARDPLL